LREFDEASDPHYWLNSAGDDGNNDDNNDDDINDDDNNDDDNNDDNG
jgi:hypothetical protein